MVAFAGSLILALAGFGAFVAYARRRPLDATLTWGEAIFASTLVFFLMFWSYGVVPHQWLTYATAELEWTPTKALVGWRVDFLGGPEEGIAEFLLPFVVNFEIVAHIVVIGIYGLFLGMHVAAWSIWQNRAKAKTPELPTSNYGRPLVKGT